MKLAKSILCGVAALGMTAGAAVAMDAHTSSSVSTSEPSYVLIEEPTYLVYEETYVIADPSFDGQVAWNDSPSSNMTSYYIYDVDDNMDGTPDRQMIIERSDTVASLNSDASLDESLGG